MIRSFVAGGKGGTSSHSAVTEYTGNRKQAHHVTSWFKVVKHERVKSSKRPLLPGDNTERMCHLRACFGYAYISITIC